MLILSKLLTHLDALWVVSTQSGRSQRLQVEAQNRIVAIRLYWPREITRQSNEEGYTVFHSKRKIASFIFLDVDFSTLSTLALRLGVLNLHAFKNLI